jgi:hypothetical protein
MRSEFRFNRRYGRRTVAGWSRRGYRTRGYSKPRISKAVYSSSRPTSFPAESSIDTRPTQAYRRSSGGNGLNTGCRDFMLGLCFVLAVILALSFVVFLF